MRYICSYYKTDSRITVSLATAYLYTKGIINTYSRVFFASFLCTYATSYRSFLQRLIPMEWKMLRYDSSFPNQCYAIGGTGRNWFGWIDNQWQNQTRDNKKRRYAKVLRNTSCRYERRIQSADNYCNLEWMCVKWCRWYLTLFFVSLAIHVTCAVTGIDYRHAVCIASAWKLSARSLRMLL